MIKRPGTENYLQKLIEEERKAYLEDFLSVDHNDTDTKLFTSHDNEEDGEEEEQNGLVMRK